MPRINTKNRNPLQQKTSQGYYVKRKRICAFCRHNIIDIDHKDVDMLSRFINPFGRINPARRNHACAKHQRKLTIAIKRARILALVPFVN